jgi:HD-GYP domain-containing protein (c-di-GMP phosphodiesterase class II)
MGIDELGQLLRMSFPSSVIYFITSRPSGFDRLVLMKNGFNEAFLLPIDREILKGALVKIIENSELEVLSPVKLVDIEPNSKLDFGVTVYLPANKKFLTLSRAGHEMSEKRMDKLREHGHNTFYIDPSEMQAFYNYSAKRLKALLNPGSMSETERKDKLGKSVRELVTGMLSSSYSSNLSSGKKVVEHTKKIVKQYIMISNPKDWYQRLMTEVNEKGDGYSHTGSVSVYAVLFGMLLNVGNPEDLAMAGLFHDLGMLELPPELQTKSPKDMNAEEFEVYSKHPELSIKTIQARSLAVPDQIIKAILQHHEKWNGTGFPNKIEGRQFIPEAQVLAIADRFDYLTRISHNLTPLEPVAALNQIDAEKVVNPTYIATLKQAFQAKKAA